LYPPFVCKLYLHSRQRQSLKQPHGSLQEAISNKKAPTWPVVHEARIPAGVYGSV
jgi:hypothetical protein